VVAIAALLPFVVWPGIERPFSTPKIFLLGGFDIVAAGVAFSTGHFKWPSLPRGFQVSLIAWAGALGASSLVGEFVSPQVVGVALCPLVWFVLVAGIQPKPEHLAAGVVGACAGLSLIALLQYSGLDPFRLLGWTTPAYGSPRMRVFGTLGNPNFVAAFLAGALPVSVVLRRWLSRRALVALAIALPTAALLATGSRAGLLAATSLLIWLGIVRRFRGWRPIIAGVLVLLGLLPLMPARALAPTLSGRLYIWRVTSSHLLERPLFGYGPGAFEAKFIEWETAYWREGRGSADQRQFAGLQAHAHNDYLEVLVDRGWVGLLSLLVLIASFLVFAFQQTTRSPTGLMAAGSAGLVALATVAFVDFPLHRPTELCLFWTLIAVVYLEAEQRTSAAGS